MEGRVGGREAKRMGTSRSIPEVLPLWDSRV